MMSMMIMMVMIMMVMIMMMMMMMIMMMMTNEEVNLSNAMTTASDCTFGRIVNHPQHATR